MKKLIIVLTILPVLLLAASKSDSFTNGDYLFVKAQLIGCGSQVRFVEVGQVTESGQVTLFNDIQLKVEGRTPSEITAELVDILEQRTGHKSKTIKIMRVPAEDPKKAAILMMLIHSERSRNCEPPNQNDVPDWLGEFQIAHRSSHNKTLKFVPALRASTGRKNAAHFYAA